ncbi:hypothetical protein Tco_0565098 [Tanacetum coccineum]
MYSLLKRLLCRSYNTCAIDLEVTRPDPYSAATQFGGVTDWYQEPRGNFLASDKELEGPMKDQPLSADASPTALSPGYIADSNPEEDKEDPEEDPADHPADG